MDMNKRLAGIAVAGAAAALFLAGCSTPGSTAKFEDPAFAKVKCYGANACKGQAECKTAMNGCKGQNECKGHGFVMLEEAACVQRLGRA